MTQREGETDFELPDNVLFDLDSAHVSRDADQVLQEIADAAHDSAAGAAGGGRPYRHFGHP